MPLISGDVLETPIAGLLATPPARLPYQPDVLLRSFVLERPAGNVLVYNSPGLTTAAVQIRDLGPANPPHDPTAPKATRAALEKENPHESPRRRSRR